MGRAPALLRAGVLGLLGVALLWGAGGSVEGGAGARVLELEAGSGTWPSAADGALLAVRPSGEPPTPQEIEVLEGVARSVPILAVQPASGGVWAEAPRAPRAERAAALPFGVQGGEPEGEVTARILDGAGVLDSLRLRLDPSGGGGGAFRLRPARGGWHEWRVEVEGVGAQTVGAWVREAAAPRVLVVAGPPTWESRFLLRALDEAGVETTAVLPLGQGFQAGAREGIPTGAGGLEGLDAVVVLPGAAVDAAARRALEAFVLAGGGVAAVGRPELWRALGVAREGGMGAATEPVGMAGTGIRWSLPPELVPLPAEDLRTAALPLGPLEAASHPVASDGEGPLLALRPLGSGRVAALGVLESWRWRMEAGRVEEHREFWRGLVEWLAGEGPDAPPVRVSTGVGAAGVPVVLERFPVQDGGEGGAFLLEHPDGARELLQAEAPDPGGSLRAAFLPVGEGVYRIEGGEGTTPTGFRAVAPGAAGATRQAPGEPVAGGPRSDAVARLALLAHRSGGGLVEAPELEEAVEARLAAAGTGGGGSWLHWVLLAGIVALALGEWSLRRLSGRP